MNEYNNIYQEPVLTNDIYSEYLNLLKYYQNIKRQSIFVKYFNISETESIYNDDLSSTYDLYSNSNIKFDLFDLTPIYSIDPITNNSENSEDLDGQKMTGTTNIVIYTLDKPKINDLVEFYNPIKSGEIFKVKNITTPVNMIYSSHENKHFQLELEYAPIEMTSDLPISNRFVYDLFKEKNIEYNEYVEKIKIIKEIDQYINRLNKYFNKLKDCYTFNNIAPLLTNKLLYTLKLNIDKYKKTDEFILFYSPYGLLDYISDYDINSEFSDNNRFYSTYNFNDNVKNKILWCYNNYDKKSSNFLNDNLELSMNNLMFVTYEFIKKLRELQWI